MKPPPFDYHRADSLGDAYAMLAEGGEEAKLLAGGQSLMPLLAYRLARPSHLVDVGGLPELMGCTADDTRLVVRALTTHDTLHRSTPSTGPWAALKQSAGLIGHYPIRVRGTLGGSLAHADPSAELPVVCVALDAELHVGSSRGRRVCAADQFFTGPFTTTLADDEVLLEAHFPAWPGVERRSAFAEFSTRVGDFATASVAVSATIDDGRMHDPRIVLGSVATTPLRAHEAEHELAGLQLDERVAARASAAAAAACTWDGDGADKARFRGDLVRCLTRDALDRLANPQ